MSQNDVIPHKYQELVTALSELKAGDIFRKACVSFETAQTEAKFYRVLPSRGSGETLVSTITLVGTKYVDFSTDLAVIKHRGISVVYNNVWLGNAGILP
jgi:hypothetical protein